MNRLLGLSALVLLAATGCRMCACPYDYCGPVVECGCVGGEGCGGNSMGPPGEGAVEENGPAMNGEVVPPDAPPTPPPPANSPTSYNGASWKRHSPTLASR
ncbi:MAG TPA: hypothetical protein VGI75_00795 [Pirellulales bacterium]